MYGGNSYNLFSISESSLMWAEQEEKWKRRGEEEDAELNVHRPKNTRQQTEL